MSTKLVLVGADLHITTVQTNNARRRRDTWHRYTCTCPTGAGKWYAWEPDAQVQAEVHARLHHGAEPDRGRWRNSHG